MPRTRSRYICQQCGSQYPQEYGRCPGCGSWSSLVETVAEAGTVSRGRSGRTAPAAPEPLAAVQSTEHKRLRIPIEEFNHVLGGGIVPGSLILTGGDPGIGKSTLLLQVSELVARISGDVLYVTGEESAEQVKLRADRLGPVSPGLYILPETDLDVVLATAANLRPHLLVIDSIQTMQCPDLESPAGSVGQIREATARLLRLAKDDTIATCIVGHVTKEGNLAGPKVLEHMVDTVLYLEGDPHHAYRILRSVKNRFGPSNEIGVFDMQEGGMVGVANPSALFLGDHAERTSGSAVTVTIEGTRSLLVEIQALCTPTHFGLPRRTATGLDLNRLLMLTAVLAKRSGLRLSSQDVYVNVVGGLKLNEPAVDLGVAAAIASSFCEVPLAEAVMIGEVGLGGEVRPVTHIRRRVSEAAKLGFTRAVVSRRSAGDLGRVAGMDVLGVASVREALEVLGIEE